jgi:hypothetical protein
LLPPESPAYNAWAKREMIWKAYHNFDMESALNNCILAESNMKVEQQYSLHPTRNVRESSERLYATIIYFLISTLSFVTRKPRYVYAFTGTWCVKGPDLEYEPYQWFTASSFPHDEPKGKRASLRRHEPCFQHYRECWPYSRRESYIVCRFAEHHDRI